MSNTKRGVQPSWRQIRGVGFVAALLAGGAVNAGAGWFDVADWLAAVTYRQNETAVYFDATGKFPPEVKVIAGTDERTIKFELVNIRVTPDVYTLAPRDSVVDNIRLEAKKRRNDRWVEVTVETAKPFPYDIERRQVTGGVSQVILRFSDVAVKRSPPSTEGKTALYARPDRDSRILAFVPYYTQVEVLDFAKEMYLVKTDDGMLAWVPRKHMKIKGEDPFVTAQPTPPRRGPREQIIATAKGYLGTPYVWGGTSAEGFDCSGLVQTVFAENGIQLPRGSGEQYRQGKKIAKRNMRPGDLVFFHTYTSGPSHVGIYVGDGKFLHAESSPRGVTITPLSEPYWEKRFLGSRRWLEE